MIFKHSNLIKKKTSLLAILNVILYDKYTPHTNLLSIGYDLLYSHLSVYSERIIYRLVYLLVKQIAHGVN